MVIGKSYSVDSSHAVGGLYIPSRPINIVGDPSMSATDSSNAYNQPRCYGAKY